MTVVSNYASLSPPMRTALREGYANLATLHALESQGMAMQAVGVSQRGSQWPLTLTAAGERAAAALIKSEEIPLKIQPWLDKATALGLEVSESERSGSLRSWTVDTPNPIDNTQVWIYWTDSARGGRVGFTVYHGSSVRPTRKATRRFAAIAMTDMGESLQRHLDREARKAAELAIEPADAVPSTVVPTVERHQADPTRPGWLVVGQHIHDHVTGDSYQVTAVELGRDGKVARVAVTVNGGYGGAWRWYGDHPDAFAGLQILEGDHIGLAGHDRRPWPRLRAAHEAIRRLLMDQVLSGWAAGIVYEKPADGGYVVVNIPDGTDPTRHLELLRRYVPYRATVELRSSTTYDRYSTIVIEPRKD